MKLHIAKGLELPVDAATQTFAVLGIRGSGKTNTGVVLTEELLKAGQQVAVIDPVDVWWGLKSARSGKEAGFPVPVLGGDEHSDVPLEAGSGAVVADFVVDSRASVILSLRHLSIDEQRRFATAFAKRLFDRKKPGTPPLHLVVDEADEFVPQRIPPGHEAMFGAFDRIVRRGRVSGIGVTLISQRAQVLNKDVLSQAETLVAMRVLHKLDRKAMEAWIEAHDTEGRRDEFMASLASLERGEAWIWSPSWLGIFRRIQVRQRETYDSSATPSAGAKIAPPKKLAPVDLDQLRAAMADTIERAKADDPRELKRRISELERDLRRGGAQPAVDVAALSARAKEEALEGLRLELAGWKHAMTSIGGALKTVHDNIDSLYEKLDRATSAGTPPARTVADQLERLAPVRKAARPSPARSAPLTSSNGDVGSGAMRLLKALAQRHPMRVTKAQLATLAGLSAGGGTFNTYLSRLRVAGYLEEGNGFISVSPTGMSAADTAPAAPQTTEELVAMWRANIGSGAARMLDVLVLNYPRQLTRENLAHECGMALRGGTFNTYLSRLRANGLADVNGSEVRASTSLFEL